jgi:hypothetical protein
MDEVLYFAKLFHEALWFNAAEFGGVISEKVDVNTKAYINVSFEFDSSKKHHTIRFDGMPNVSDVVERSLSWFRHYGRTPVVVLKGSNQNIWVEDHYNYDDAGVRLPGQPDHSPEDFVFGDAIRRMSVSEFLASGHVPGPFADLYLRFRYDQNESIIQRDLKFDMEFFLPWLKTNISPKEPLSLRVSGSGKYHIPGNSDRNDVMRQLHRLVGLQNNHLFFMLLNQVTHMGGLHLSMNLKPYTDSLSISRVTESIMYLVYNVANKIGLNRGGGILTRGNTYISLFRGDPPEDAGPVEHSFRKVKDALEFVHSKPPQSMICQIYLPPDLDEQQRYDLAEFLYKVHEQTGLPTLAVNFSMNAQETVLNNRPILKLLEHRRLTGHLGAAAAPMSRGGRNARRRRSRSVKRQSFGGKKRSRSKTRRVTSRK